MGHQNLTVWQIYLLALGKGSQTFPSVEQERFLSADSEREPQRSPSSPSPLWKQALPSFAQTDRCLSSSLKPSPERQSPRHIPCSNAQSRLIVEPEDQLPEDRPQVEGRRGSQGYGREPGS